MKVNVTRDDATSANKNKVEIKRLCQLVETFSSELSFYPELLAQARDIKSYLIEGDTMVVQVAEPTKPHTEDVPPEPSIKLEFVNRSREIEYIVNPARTSLMLIDAPPGLGKTALLMALQKWFESAGWQCVYVNLSKSQGKLGQTLTEVPNGNQVKWVFLFDDLEQATGADLEWLFKEFLPTCRYNLPREGFRAIFAGRYIESNTGVARWIGVEKMHLSPFSQQVVEKMIENTLSRTSERLESHQIEVLAKTIIELSGGHPRSIRNLIDHLAERRWKIPVTRAEKQELFRQCTDKEVNLVTNKLGKETRDCLESIFVFRRFNLKTLKFLQQRNEINREADVLQILSKLSQKRFVTRKDGGIFYSVQIVRDLILARLRLFEPERYRELNQIAHELYKQWIEYELERPDAQDNPISSSDLIPILVSENIYHICQGYPQTVRMAEIALTCIRKNRDYLARALGGSSDVDYYQKYLKDLVMRDEDIRTFFDDHGFSIDIVFEIAFHSQHQDNYRTGLQNSIGDNITQRHGYDWLVDALDMLRHNAQNVLVERWEKRNLGRALTPPVFVDRPIPREQLEQTLPRDNELRWKLSNYQDANRRFVLINEKYVTNLEKQMELAQRTVSDFELELTKALSPSDKIRLKQELEEYQEKFDEAAGKLADIYVYIYSV